MKIRPAVLVGIFVIVLVFCAMLRLSAFQPSALSAYSGYATPLYIIATIAAAIALGRSGVVLDRVGLAGGLRWQHIGLALLGIAALQLAGRGLGPVWSTLFAAPPELGRFDGISGSLATYLSTLALSWTFAAFGEEIAYRVILLRGAAAALGGSRKAWLFALVFQAVVFGIAHLYQGPAGMAATMINGLIFGSLVLFARGSVWPAVLAHGGNNMIGLTILYLE